MDSVDEPSAKRRTQVLKLPPQAQANDAALHALAAQLLRLQYVRSVTVDEDRAAAVVRFTSRQPASEGDVAACCFADAMESPVKSSATPPAIVTWFDPRDRSVAFVRMPPRAQGWRKGLYLVLSGAFLFLALIGIVLPGLPTTPFVLLGSYFLLRSSERLHQRLIGSRLFGGILRDWHIHRGVRPYVRARAITVVGAVVVVSLVVAQPPWPLALTILALVACGLFVIWRLPTVEDVSPS